MCTTVIVLWKTNRDFAQCMIYSMILQEESHYVRLAGDMLMEKLGFNLALREDSGTGT